MEPAHIGELKWDETKGGYYVDSEKVQHKEGTIINLFPTNKQVEEETKKNLERFENMEELKSHKESEEVINHNQPKKDKNWEGYGDSVFNIIQSSIEFLESGLETVDEISEGVAGLFMGTPSEIIYISMKLTLSLILISIVLAFMIVFGIVGFILNLL